MNKSLIYALITIVIWGTSAPTVKVITETIPRMQALAIGSGIAAIFLFCCNIASGKLKLLKSLKAKDLAIMAGLGSLGLFLYYSLYYYGIEVLTTQEACIVNYLWPIMILIFSILILKESLTFKKLLAMACSFGGIVLLVLDGSSSQGSQRLAGIAACGLCAVCYGLFSVLNKKNDYNQNISMMIFWLVTSIESFAVSFATRPWTPVTMTHVPGFLWLGIAVDAVGYLFWALALSGAKNTAFIANLAYLTPFITVALSALVLKEELKVTALIALIIIIGGILIQSTEKQ